MVTLIARCAFSHLRTYLTNTKIYLTKNKAFHPTVEKAGHKKKKISAGKNIAI